MLHIGELAPWSRWHPTRFQRIQFFGWYMPRYQCNLGNEREIESCRAIWSLDQVHPKFWWSPWVFFIDNMFLHRGHALALDLVHVANISF